jgi:catecholate siderophore receptor
MATIRTGLLAASAASAMQVMAAMAESTADDMRFAMVADQITVEGARVDYGGASTRTATKTDTELIDIPQSISVISRDLIEDASLRNLGDVLRYVSGASTQQGEGHRDAVTLRGSGGGSTADFFVDGVRDDAEYFRDFYNAERIEILKGPNAMIFGRGAGGGLINRVIKRAEFDPTREIRLEGGQFGFGRGAVDVGGGVSPAVALRFNGFYENADSYRDFVGAELFGLNPTATARLGEETAFRLSYEFFNDERTVDRGVPSVEGPTPRQPFRGDRDAFFGNPDQSFSEFERHAATATLEHAFSHSFTLKNQLSYASNDKFYSNVFASAFVRTTGAPAQINTAALQSYFSSQQRRNLFNQTDLVWKVDTGPIGHALLLGAEFGVQKTDNFRTPNNAAGSVNIASPTTFAPAPFAGIQSDNLVDLTVAGVYLQDQIELGRYVQLIGGVRFDHFDLEFDDQRAGASDFERDDSVVSPRGGVIIKPVENASLYISYSRSFLPQSGDQFNSLTATLADLEPEEFENLEVGLKWNINPRLELSAAVYRLDRENTRATDPVTLLTVLTGAQRSRGAEVGLAGSITEDWQIFAGYAWQDAEITRTTAAAPAGRNVPFVPQQSFSLWTTYRVLPRLRLGAGVVHQADRFTSFSNTTIMPDFTRFDAAAFFEVSDRIELQVNVENIGNTLYFPTAHNDNNITPGAPRSVRAALTARL